MSHKSNAVASNSNTPFQPINARAGALEMARRGFRVFPVRPHLKVPFTREDAQRVPALEGGINRATKDREKIETWFAQHPDINYGIATGDGLVALDCDASKDNFWEDYHELMLPTATLEFASARGGYHVLLQFNDFAVGQKDLAGAKSINVRAEGGYIVGPGQRV